MNAKNKVGIRRALILFYLESGEPKLAELVDPAYYSKDLLFLKKEGLVKNKKITSEGERRIKIFPPKVKRRMRRIYFSEQDR